MHLTTNLEHLVLVALHLSILLWLIVQLDHLGQFIRLALESVSFGLALLQLLAQCLDLQQLCILFYLIRLGCLQ